MREHSIVPLFALLTLGLIFWSIESRVTKTRATKERKTEAPIAPYRTKDQKTEEHEKSTTEAIPQEFDIQAKRDQVEILVNKATVAFEKSKTLEEIFNAITSGQEYKKGEIYCYVYDMEGTSLAIGEHTDMIWQDFYNYRDSFGFPVVQRLIETAKQGGGWVTYEWQNAVKISYVKKVSKFGKDYVIGAGYYPFSKKDNVVMLVKGAVALFKKDMSEGKPISEAFAEFGYPLGRFVIGDLYLYSVCISGKDRGVQFAHGVRSGLIGTNAWEYKDQEGTLVNQAIAKLLSETTDGVWVDYVSNKAPKKAYAEKVVDTKGNEYFIACGYYPDADRKAVVDLVDKGYQFLKSNGISAAADQFNDIDNMEFRYGDLYLSVYDLKGKCLADGVNASLAGTNMFDAQDEAGRYYVREMIEKAKKSRGWLDFKFKNSFKSFYVDIVDMGIENVVICCGLYPSSKMETMILLAKSASSYLKSAPKIKDACAAFVKPTGGEFLRGDLSVFVFARDGICFAYGDKHELIWQNLSIMKDDNGTSLVDMFNNLLDRGPGKIMYTVKGESQIAYIESVERDGTSYVVGSSFYR